MQAEEVSPEISTENDSEGIDFDLNMFEEEAAKPVTTNTVTTNTTVTPKVVRSFPMGKWTGKTPKDLLFDFVRKQFNQNQPPKYHQLSGKYP